MSAFQRIGFKRASATGIAAQSRTMKKRLILCFLCAVVLFVLMISTDSNFVQHVAPFLDNDFSDVTCYQEARGPYSLPDFDLESVAGKATSDRNIFFHETSCFGDGGLVLNARQACAVESAAKMNPNMNVYLLFISPSKVSNQSAKMFDLLRSYSNVRINHIYPEKYMRFTPLDAWYKSGVLSRSRWPTSHMSDILRYLTLWKYGGVYLDLDVVVTTSLEGLQNFAGAEDWNHVAAGVLGFDASELGRWIADACVHEMKESFRGDIWGNNGPGVITRILQKICTTKHVREMTTSRCHGFKVFSPSAFYPVHYKNWKIYFQTEDNNATMKRVENALAIHVWNKLSKFEEVRVDSDVPYAVIARKYCPKIFNSCEKVF